MKPTVKMLKEDFQACLNDGIRPVELLLCSIQTGSVCSYPLKNSKSINEDLIKSLPSLDKGWYYTFSVNLDPIMENYSE